MPARGDSSRRIHASSTTVSPRTTQPASGTSASPTATAASARGSVSISKIPTSAPSGSAQYQAGSVTSPSTSPHSVSARLDSVIPITPDRPVHAKSRHVVGSPISVCRRVVQRASGAGG